MFNRMYYHRQKEGDSTVPYGPFFYPLDSLLNWNRIYGRRGFLQYQFVLPFQGGASVLREILTRIATETTGSFLAVLKTFGEQEGILSFPMPGYTLALDFPMRKGIIPFLRGLNGAVIEGGGRVYLAKDAILEKSEFAAMYPRLGEFLEVKRKYDPENRFGSLLSRRLGIT